MKTALITLSAEGARLLSPLTGRLPEARLFVHESVQHGPGREAPEAERFSKIADLTALLWP